MRKRFFDDIARVERGEDPSGLIRDPAKNECIMLPIASRELLIDGLPLAEMLDDPSIDPRKGFLNIAGQPRSVYLAFMDAMGLDPEGDVLPSGELLLAAAATSGKKTRLVWS